MSCRKCGQFGHYARNCPPGGGDGRDRSSGSSSSGGSSGGGCYICGGRHFARECPNNSGGRDGGRLCFSCHQPGHFAEACPNRSGGSRDNYRDSHYRDHGSSYGRDNHYRDKESDYGSRGHSQSSDEWPSHSSRDSDRASDRSSAAWPERERDVPLASSVVGTNGSRDVETAMDASFAQPSPVGGEFVAEPGRLEEIINSSSPYGGDSALESGSSLPPTVPLVQTPVPASTYVPAAQDGGSPVNGGSSGGGGGGSCFNCGGPHFARECPTAKEGRACYVCNQTGHLAVNCPNKPPGSSGSGCYTCGGPHFARECPATRGSGGGPAPAGNCFVCHQPGHIANLCPLKNDDIRGSSRGGGGGSSSGCYVCGGRHFARECPNGDRSYGRSGSSSYGRSSGYSSRGGGGGGGDCYVCGGRHFARECPNRPRVGGSRYRSRSRSRSRSPRSHYRSGHRSRSRERGQGHRSRSRSRERGGRADAKPYSSSRSYSSIPYPIPPHAKPKYDYHSSKPKSREGCFICGDFGHFAKECPQKTEDRYSSSGSRGGLNGGSGYMDLGGGHSGPM